MKILKISLLVQSVLGQNAEFSFALRLMSWLTQGLPSGSTELALAEGDKGIVFPLMGFSYFVLYCVCVWVAKMGVVVQEKASAGCWASSSPAPPSFLETRLLSEAISSSPAGQGALGIHSSLPSIAVTARHPPSKGKAIITGGGGGVEWGE